MNWLENFYRETLTRRFKPRAVGVYNWRAKEIYEVPNICVLMSHFTCYRLLRLLLSILRQRSIYNWKSVRDNETVLCEVKTMAGDNGSHSLDPTPQGLLSTQLAV
jgi:hypothetical protein